MCKQICVHKQHKLFIEIGKIYKSKTFNRKVSLFLVCLQYVKIRFCDTFTSSVHKRNA